MKILILGGTGAMGQPLVEVLSKQANELYVTSRRKMKDTEGVHYIQGDAKNDLFLESVLKDDYDVIADFMVYGTEQLKARIDKLLTNTKQYLFFSSSRVYAESNFPLVESSPRLLDHCDDQQYLATDEYALAKAREENIFFNVPRNNWTIIRPYITYNTNRLQLGVFEKELWLKRALEGKSIVFPKDIAIKSTTMTYGADVAMIISKLIGNDKALGRVFHIATSQSVKWEDILECYLGVIKREAGVRPKVIMPESSRAFQKILNPWQIKYDRLFDRMFDNSAILDVCGEYVFTDVMEGLDKCLTAFIENPVWLDSCNVKYEACCDRISGDRISLKNIKGKRDKLRYIKWRYLEKG